MNDRTIEHEADVRVVIQEEIGTKFPTPDPESDAITVIKLNPENSLSDTYNHAQLESRLDDVAEAVNKIADALNNCGIIIAIF